MASIEGEKTTASVRAAVRSEVCAALWRMQPSRGCFFETALASRERLPSARDLAWNHPWLSGAVQGANHLGAPRGQGDESGNLSQVLTHARRPVRYYLFGPGGCL